MTGINVHDFLLYVSWFIPIILYYPSKEQIVGQNSHSGHNDGPNVNFAAINQFDTSSHLEFSTTCHFELGTFGTFWDIFGTYIYIISQSRFTLSSTVTRL